MSRDEKDLFMYTTLFLLFSFVVYLFGSLIAWDFNPANWWLLGRIIAIVLILRIFWVCLEKLNSKL